MGFNIYEFFDYLSSRNVEVRLDAGQPDLPVDDRIVSALIDSLRRGETRYVSASGINELREKLAEEHEVDPSEVIIAPGSKFLIASQVYFSRKVAIISPYWPAYVQMVENFGRECKIIKTSLEDNWMPNFDELNGVDTIIINYPNNPTGVSLPKEKMDKLVEIAAQENIKIVSDEVYRDIVFNNKFKSILDYNYERKIFVHSFSKTFSMTGFRIGYAIADREEIRRIRKILEITATCVPKFVQMAAIKALEIKEEIVKKVREFYRARLKLFMEKIDKDNFQFVVPDGSFYVFVKMKKGYSGEKAAYKLAEEGVGVFPGEAFGGYNGFLRLSLTHPKLELGIEKINKLSDKL